MKTFILAIVVLIAGVAVGLGSSTVRFSNKTYFGFSKPYAGLTPQSEPEPVDVTLKNEVLLERPKAEIVGSDVYDFGVMMKGENRDCEFVVKNTGNGTLSLAFDSKSCQCTDVRIAKPNVPPNESTTIYLSWRPRKFAINFSQNAIFRTNDPTRRELQFTIKGRVQELARTFPFSINFNNVTQADTQNAKVFVYGYRDTDLKITNVEVLNDEYKDFFELSVGELEQKGIDAEPGAKSGEIVNIVLKPGAPMGSLYSSIRIAFNKNDVAPLDVSVRAKVEGQISVIGPQYSDENEQLYMGGVGSSPKETKIWVLMKGEHHSDCKLELKTSDPAEVLTATIGEPTRSERNSRFPVQVKVTPIDKLVNRLGNQQGEIGTLVFTTGHEDIPEFVLPVAFSVEAKK